MRATYVNHKKVIVLNRHPFVIAISGGSGSGKTTIVNSLAAELSSESITLLGQDHYYRHYPELSFDERCKLNYDHPDSIDSHLFYEHILALKQGRSIEKPVYDYSQHQRSDKTELLEPKRVVFVDGIFSLYYKKVRDIVDLKLYVDVPADVRFIRRLKRDIKTRGRSMKSVIDQYQETVRPMHEKFVEPSKKYADIVINWLEYEDSKLKSIASLLSIRSTHNVDL